MTDDKYISLIHKTLDQTITAAEQEELSAWMAESEDHVKTFDEITQVWRMTDHYPTNINIDLDQAYAQVQDKISKIDTASAPSTNIHAMSPPPSRRSWMAVAASFLILATVGWIIWRSNGELAQHTITHIASVDNEQFILPDQSVIRLEKGSQISYNKEFTSRDINFTGSGYFKIANDANRPFSIKAPHSEVQVLGTMFVYEDTRDGADGFVQMTEGKVQLTVGSDSAILQSIDGARFSQGKITDHNADIDLSEFEWHTYVFNYDNAPLSKVAQEVGVLMDARLIVPDHLKDCTFTGELSATSLKDMAEIIGAVYAANVIKHQYGYQLSGGSCQ